MPARLRAPLRVVPTVAARRALAHVTRLGAVPLDVVDDDRNLRGRRSQSVLDDGEVRSGRRAQSAGLTTA